MAQKRLIHEKWDSGRIINDIEVSSIKDYKNEKGLKPFRVRFITNQNMLEAMALLSDVSEVSHWYKSLEKNKILMKSPTRMVVHRILKRKLFFKKRDYVIEAINFLDFADKKMTILTKSVDIPFVEVPSLHQRAALLDGFLTIRANSANETEIQMASVSDLGGWCPAMLSNKLVQEELLSFASALKHELESKEKKISPMLESFRARLYRER